MVIGSLLKWGGSTSGVSTDFMGLLGILVLILGAAIAAVGGLRAFSPGTSLPSGFVGFTLDQLCFTAALAIFVWTFALITESGIKFGLHLTWIGAAAAAAGSVLAMRSAPAGEPTSI
jgi:hypothetical protein